MSESDQERDKPVGTGGESAAGQSSELFHPAPERSGGVPLAAWVAAGGVVLAILVGILLVGRHRAPTITGVQPLDPYAGSLSLSQLQMSESTSLAGGKSTYVDGVVRNTGSSTVTGITVQVLFHNEEQMPPQIETLPMALIRTHEPYVDTEPVSAAPLAPGDQREFRLIFESIPGNWNMQMPEIRIIRVEKK